MRHALAFYTKYSGWHGFNARCPSTVSAIKRLGCLGVLEVNAYNQARHIFIKNDNTLSNMIKNLH